MPRGFHQEIIMKAKTTASKTTKLIHTKDTKAKRVKPAEPQPSNTGEKLTALGAAARVLAETKQPMSCPELIAAMAAKGYWRSPAGKTPHATLSSAIQREIEVKKDQSRFKKTAPGHYALA
jgi:hypothetical protein